MKPQPKIRFRRVRAYSPIDGRRLKSTVWEWTIYCADGITPRLTSCCRLLRDCKTEVRAMLKGTP